jgi:hypothetical protein
MCRSRLNPVEPSIQPRATEVQSLKTGSQNKVEPHFAQKPHLTFSED